MAHHIADHDTDLVLLPIRFKDIKIIPSGLIAVHGRSAYVETVNFETFLGEQALLNFPGQIDIFFKLQAMSELAGHLVEIFGELANLIAGGHF